MALPFWHKPVRCPSWLLTLLVTAYLLAVFNVNFFSTVSELHGQASAGNGLYLASLFVLLWAAMNLILTLVALPLVLKPVLVVLLIGSACASYFMQTYNVLLDNTMMQNVFETDVHEATELLSAKMVVYVLIAGVLPALLVVRTRIIYGTPLRFIASKSVSLLASAAVIGVVAMMFYQDYASLFRNNRYIRDMIVPVNYLHAINAYATSKMPKHQAQFTTLGEDAHLGNEYSAGHPQRHVTVLVVGETARAANFSLLGYERKTTPRLAQEDVLAFSQVHSCGTATAVSVPCMFSRLDRDHYDEQKAKHSDGLLDVAQRAGLKVVWLDNNSGCKGTCDRVSYHSTGDLPADSDIRQQFCSEGEHCFDEAMLAQLQQTLANSNDDLLIVLHQLGSHGPAYYLRTPAAFQQFIPTCTTNQLQECTQQEITNAYDNTILYTDYFLAQVINYLKSQPQLNSSLVYVSDHGESLGENNLYLHGLPYFMAPDEQTHVPMVMWISDNYAQAFGIDKQCLQGKVDAPFSQDNLFDSMLGLMDVQTDIYQPKMDIFNGCRSSVAKATGTRLAANEQTVQPSVTDKK